MRSHTRQKIIPSAGEYHVLSTPEKKNLPDDIWFSEQPPSSRASFFSSLCACNLSAFQLLCKCNRLYSCKRLIMVHALHVKGKWKCKTISTALNKLLTRFGYSEYFCRRFFFAS